MLLLLALRKSRHMSVSRRALDSWRCLPTPVQLHVFAWSSAVLLKVRKPSMKSELIMMSEPAARSLRIR